MARGATHISVQAGVWEILNRISHGVRLASSGNLVEPGYLVFFAVSCSTLLGITDLLTRLELDAILAHELCHIRRHDNLAAAAHKLVDRSSGFILLSGGWAVACLKNANAPATKPSLNSVHRP